MQISNLISSGEGYCPATDDLSLFYRYYKAKNHKAGVLIIHGFAEHSGRYGHLVESLLREGYSVLLIDLRGHGRSGGRRGFILNFQEYVNDVKIILKKGLKIFGEEKMYLIAHSMGGLIASFLTIENQHMIRGLVLSSPAFGMNMEIPIWKSALGKLVSSFWPSLSLKSTINPQHLSKDQQVVEDFRNDPLIFRHVSSRLYTEVLQGYQDIEKMISKITIPIYFQISGNDLIVSSKKSLEIFQKLTSPDRKINLYDDYLHEIYNEEDKEHPINDLVMWINGRQNAYSS